MQVEIVESDVMQRNTSRVNERMWTKYGAYNDAAWICLILYQVQIQI